MVEKVRPAASRTRTKPRTISRTTKRSIAIVGAGNLGTALAVSLDAAGYRVSEVVSRSSSRRNAQRLARKTGGRAVIIGQSPIQSRVVWICVPDRAIRACAAALAPSGGWNGRIVFHSSGALGRRELRSLQRRGASVASVHPLMTFVAGVVPRLTGVSFAVEGDLAALRIARQIVRDLGGQPFDIKSQHKAAYHAWGAFASPLLLSLWVAAEQVAGLAGVPKAEARRRMLPIIRQTLANYEQRGPDKAFSGPIIRGDAGTLVKHLQVLRKVPEVRAVYLALARSALRNLPTKNKKQLSKVLG